MTATPRLAVPVPLFIQALALLLVLVLPLSLGLVAMMLAGPVLNLGATETAGALGALGFMLALLPLTSWLLHVPLALAYLLTLRKGTRPGWLPAVAVALVMGLGWGNLGGPLVTLTVCAVLALAHWGLLRWLIRREGIA